MRLTEDPTFVHQVREVVCGAVSVKEHVGRYTEVKALDGELCEGKCPLPNCEGSDSFYVSGNSCWQCFDCGRSGDVVDLEYLCGDYSSLAEAIMSFATEYGVELPNGSDAKGDESEERKPTQAELLIRCAAGAELFHTPGGDAYATVPVGGHQETHPINAKGFRRWLVRRFYEQFDRPPGAQALQDALGFLEARAQSDGTELEVHVRVAEYDGAIYVDLANEQWEAVEITGSGWRVISSDATPVRFRRPRGMLPLPAPTRDGLAKELRRFINIPDEDEASWRLLLAWLVQALRPKGPYPVLILQGEQGSAKSTVERLLRALVDPSTAPLRTTPRNERDLIIAATNSWCVAFDNISTLPPWCSDALCRLSTGGGFSARELYTDAEEVLFDATRPVILNGITDVATRPDLLDRALVISLPPISEEGRMPEAELWRDFDRERPAILGALFDAVAGALGTVQGLGLSHHELRDPSQ